MDDTARKLIEALWRLKDMEQAIAALKEQILERADDEAWDRQFATFPQALDKLEAEIQAEIAAGRVRDLDPDCL